MLQIPTGLRRKVFGFIEFVFTIALVIGVVEPVMAIKISNVKDTPHNLSATNVIGNFYSDGTEICVFCHTPHNATVAAPLWNHYSTAGAFTIYSSSTIEYDPNRFAGGLDVDSVSRLCLSCHEGTTGLNSIASPGASGVYPIMQGGSESFDIFFGVGGAGIGVYLSADLTSMHPVGFDYADSIGDTEIRPIADPKADGLKFFGSTGSFLECPTCHDPHVDGDWSGANKSMGNYSGDTAYKKFLRKSNTSSALCLACHNK